MGTDRPRPAHPRTTRALTILIAAAALVALAPAAASGTPVTVRAGVPATDAAGTTWLCRPGLADDPCVTLLSATAVYGNGTRTLQLAGVPTPPPVDCFYVYPTVSTARAANAPLTATPAIQEVATQQAARFSSVCQVWAPVYRQRTVTSLALGLGRNPVANQIAYQSLLQGWKDYLANDNDGRPIVFIGHSQGAAMLIQLLRSQVDDVPALRARMVAAIILGGNVTVPVGKRVGATFSHIPLCSSPGQTGCVIAYSTFKGIPVPTAYFGRPGQGVSLQSGQTATRGLQVACVNPAAIGSTAAAPLQPYFDLGAAAPRPAVPWVTYPSLYTGQCRSQDGATWLQVTDVARPGDHRPVASYSLGPNWGYHLLDVNLALGNLVRDVAVQERAYLAARP